MEMTLKTSEHSKWQHYNFSITVQISHLLSYGAQRYRRYLPAEPRINHHPPEQERSEMRSAVIRWMRKKPQICSKKNTESLQGFTCEQPGNPLCPRSASCLTTHLSCSEISLSELIASFLQIKAPTFKRCLIYSDVKTRKATNLHMWEAGRGGCFTFVLIYWFKNFINSNITTTSHASSLVTLYSGMSAC